MDHTGDVFAKEEGKEGITSRRIGCNDGNKIR